MLSKTFTCTSRQRPKRFENQTNTRPRKWVNSTFPGGYEAALADLALGNQQVIDATLSFLEVRPYFFRSGYMRKVLLRKIKQVDLAPAQRERLKGILLRQAKWDARRAEWRDT